MQDFLPDVPQEKISQPLKTSDQEQVIKEGVEVKPKNKKRLRLILLAIAIASLLLLAIGITVLESMGYGKGGQKSETTEPVREERPLLVEPKPGQIQFLFYLDENANGVFDHQEKPFTKVSVQIRKLGQVASFRTVPANLDGRVVITDLDKGEYEVSFVNYETTEATVLGSFEWPKAYELVSQQETKFEFLPSQWRRLKLGEQGYRDMVGVKNYRPQTLLVLSDGSEVKFYDPDRARVYLRSRFEDNLKRKFWIRDKSIVYLKEEKLVAFSVKDQTERELMTNIYGLKADQFYLSPGATTIVYVQGDEWRYKTKNDSCGQGALMVGGQRLKVEDGQAKLVAFWSDDRWLVYGYLTKGKGAKVYLVTCGQKKNFELQELGLTNILNLGFLDQQTLFYSDYSGSYFYDLEKDQATQYTALGAPSSVKISEDKKYISGRVGDKYVVVDYPAVKLSGVEKHYLLPINGTLSFTGDELLVNKIKDCQADGDCGQIVRIELKGSGVWEAVDSIDLKEVKAEEVIGEINI